MPFRRLRRRTRPSPMIGPSTVVATRPETDQALMTGRTHRSLTFRRNACSIRMRIRSRSYAGLKRSASAGSGLPSSGSLRAVAYRAARRRSSRLT